MEEQGMKEHGDGGFPGKRRTIQAIDRLPQWVLIDTAVIIASTIKGVKERTNLNTERQHQEETT